MARVKNSDLAVVLEGIRNQLTALSARVAQLEGERGPAEPPAQAVPQTAAAPAAATPPEPAVAEITEEEILAVSAAVAAYLGVRVRIRQIRLVGSRAWAQEGRVSIQASHRLHP
jgi:methylmalonyl-CoA carboxyltransferase 12S subunit